MDPQLQSLLQSSNLKSMIGDDPAAMQQMEGFWKFLDNLSESNPEEYKKYIDEQMKDMKEEIKKEKEEEVKTSTIVSNPGFCARVLVAKILDEKDKKTQKKDTGIQIFDFNNENQIQESFLDNDQRNDPLDEPKLYLNVVYSDQVLPPLNKARDLADQNNDREWYIIPVSFTEPQYRKTLDGLQCIHYDVHVNTCIIEKMKESDRTIKSITNYLILKFQEILKDKYIIHKKSVKFLKSKKYKDYKGTNNQKVNSFILPRENDVKVFKHMKEKLIKEQKDKEKQLQSQKEVKLPTFTAADDNKILGSGSNNSGLQQINIPGITQPKVEGLQAKKPLIMEIITKTKPKYEVKDQESQVVMVFDVEEELSAKDIDLDISQTQLKLSSKYYELTHTFADFRVDPDSVQAKFSKAKKTLTLTIDKQQ